MAATACARLARTGALALLNAVDTDVGPQSARTAVLVATLLYTGFACPSCSARTSTVSQSADFGTCSGSKK